VENNKCDFETFEHFYRNSESVDPTSLLSKACRNGKMNYDIIKFLIDEKATPSKSISDGSIFHSTCHYNAEFLTKEILDLLIKDDFDVDQIPNTYSSTGNSKLYIISNC
jgi:hypothetical protein